MGFLEALLGLAFRLHRSTLMLSWALPGPSPDALLGSPAARVSLAQVHPKLSLGLLMLSWALLRLSWSSLFARTGALKAPDALLGSPGALVVPPVPPFFPPWALGSVEPNHKATGLQEGSAGIAKRLQLFDLRFGLVLCSRGGGRQTPHNLSEAIPRSRGASRCVPEEEE